MTPTALTKAQALLRHAQYLGVKAQEFAIIATVEEGFELLEYMVAGNMGIFARHDEFIADVARAKIHNDPWEVLTDFQVLGLDILRADRLH